MKCKDVQGLFSSYMDKAMSPSETRDLEQHLAECAGCAQELAQWKDAASALTQVLACDAVPRKPLEGFVAACTAEPETSLLVAIMRLLTSPRHVLASIVAGSVALTSLLLVLVWFAGNGTPSARAEQSPMTTRLRQYEMMLGSMNAPIKRSLDNGTKEKRRSDHSRIDDRTADHTV